MVRLNEHGTLPRHVGIIMDGNGRWAQRRGLPRLYGHRAGAERLREIVEACPRLNLEYLTVFAFSSENWKRSPDEVAGLMMLLGRYIRSETEALVRNGVKVRFIGNRSMLDEKLTRFMDSLEEETGHCTDLLLTVAINYGGRDEILRAARKIAEEAAAGRLKPEDVSECMFSKLTYTRKLPDPDLIIRTSGETRISNFLLWQSAYAEFEIIDVLWPDFSPEIFEAVLSRYAGKTRKFGAVAE